MFPAIRPSGVPATPVNLLSFARSVIRYVHLPSVTKVLTPNVKGKMTRRRRRRTRTSVSLVDRLNTDLIVHVASFLDFSSMFSVSFTCWSVHGLPHRPEAWNDVSKKQWSKWAMLCISSYANAPVSAPRARNMDHSALLFLPAIQGHSLETKEARSDRLHRVESIFVEACKAGLVGLCRELIKLGVDVTTKGDRALRWACASGKVEVVKLLLSLKDGEKSGNRIVNVTADDNAPVLLACQGGHVETARLLLNLKDEKTGKLVVDVAAKENHAIRDACRRGDFKIVKFLLTLKDNDTGEFVVDVTARDNEALRLTRRNGRHKVRALLHSLKDKSGRKLVEGNW